MTRKLGLVAAGSPHTARVGIEILERGGNAVDAAIGAILAGSVTEPGLCSLGGGGTLHFSPSPADGGPPVVGDFFAVAPGLDGSPVDQLADRMDFVVSELDFGPAKQPFYIGRASAAVPGLIPGLMTAAERWGALPLAELVKPACRVIRDGVILDAFQALASKLHAPMLTHTPTLRRVFAPQGVLIGEGERCRNPDLADTLEALVAGDWRAFYRHEIGAAILADFGESAGGRITPVDLASYRVTERSPLAVEYRDHTISLNPPPAAGGTLVALALELLKLEDLSGAGWGQAEHLRALITAMRVIHESRLVASSPLDATALARWRDRFCALLAGDATPRPHDESSGPGHTTHVSAVDAAGNAAGITVTYGQGAGYAAGDTGLFLNNLMGEKDLHVGGFHRWPPGKRLATNINPTIIRDAAGGVAVLGSGGSNRIRSAILQVICNLVDFDMTPEAAVAAGRIHWEAGVLNAEIFDLADHGATVEALHRPSEQLVRFEIPNLFFGGVHLAGRRADGTLYGAGDPRRSGTVLTNTSL